MCPRIQGMPAGGKCDVTPSDANVAWKASETKAGPMSVTSVPIPP